ncbi:MAG: VWA domain-containing protein, partial [Pseudomonadota bacterium]
MRGRRIEEAKRAALMALERLESTDIVSVIAYESAVKTIVPATKVSNRRWIAERIRGLQAGGSTAIYAGVNAGAEEVRKFASRDKINRIILLSDGLANVGPKDPLDFERLGRQLSGEGIVVSTIGLGDGYNEDLMAALARTGEGNHAFVQEPQDLINFFNKEFDEALGVVAQNVEIIIRCLGDVRPIGGLGRKAEVRGRTIVFRVGQLIGGSEQVLLAEVEVPEGMASAGLDLAEVEVRYRAADTNVPMRVTTRVRTEWTDDRSLSESSADGDVMRDVTLLKARARREEAIKLRDAGRIDAARKAFKKNAAILSKARKQYGFSGSVAYDDEQRVNSEAAAKAASPAEWKRQRKTLRAIQSNQAGAKTKY